MEVKSESPNLKILYIQGHLILHYIIFFTKEEGWQPSRPYTLYADVWRVFDRKPLKKKTNSRW